MEVHVLEPEGVSLPAIVALNHLLCLQTQRVRLKARAGQSHGERICGKAQKTHGQQVLQNLRLHCQAADY